MNEPDLEQLADAARTALRASESLDPALRARLAAVRAQALAARAPRLRAWALPGAAAAAAILVAAVWLPLREPPPAAPAADAVAGEALEVMIDDVDPDFYRELELYEWLEQEAARA